MAEPNTVLNELINQIPPKVLKAKFDRAVLWRYRNGDRKVPDIDNARKFCDLLGMSLDEFYAKVKPE